MRRWNSIKASIDKITRTIEKVIWLLNRPTSIKVEYKTPDMPLT